MKKNISINLFGILYQIDEDAYQLLERYIESMKSYFSRQEGGEEIADDIEHRVAELMWQKQQEGCEAIDIDMVKEIIAKIGNPAEIDGADEADASASQSDSSASSAFTSDSGSEPLDSHRNADGQGGYDRGEGRESDSLFDRARNNMHGRRLYLDGRDKMLGGVCAGLAHYFGVGDVTLWRICTLILAFLLFQINAWWVPGFVSIIIPITYIVLWIIVPTARTPEDMLRRNGKEVNPQNINQEIINEQEEYSRMSQQAYQPAPTNNGSGCIKALFIFFLCIVLCPLLFALVFVIFGMTIAGGVTSGLLGGLLAHTPFAFLPEVLAPVQGVAWVGVLCAMIVCLVPIILIIRWLRGGDSRMSTASIVFLLILWLLALVFGVVSIAKASYHVVTEVSKLPDGRIGWRVDTDSLPNRKTWYVTVNGDTVLTGNATWRVTSSGDTIVEDVSDIIDQQMDILDKQMDMLDQQMEQLGKQMDNLDKLKN